jgi:hypothetical protein
VLSPSNGDIVTDSRAALKARGAGMPTPILDDIQTALQVPVMLRQALNTLQSEMPPEWDTGSVKEVLTTLREKLDELELQEIRRAGPQEYLLIKPLAPDAGGEFAERAAEHVRALDDLGLVIRLDS